MQLVQITFTKQEAPGTEWTNSKCKLRPHPLVSCLLWISYYSSRNKNQ